MESEEIEEQRELLWEEILMTMNVDQQMLVMKYASTVLQQFMIEKQKNVTEAMNVYYGV